MAVLCAWFSLVNTPLSGEVPPPLPPDYLFNVKAPAPLPAWLTALPSSLSSGDLNETAFALRPPTGSDSLSITVLFDEKTGGFLRLIRKDPSGAAQTLSGNLFEGTGLPNRRTLLIPGPLPEGTVLAFQAAGASSPLLRVLWQWTSPKTLSATEGDVIVLLGRTALSAAETTPLLPPPPPASEVAAGYTSTPLLAQPLQVPSPGAVQFTALFDQLPRHSRLEGKVSGLPAGIVLECRVNDAKVGVLGSLLPSLKDVAWSLPADGPASPVGWQTGSLVIPRSAWRAGENRIELIPVAAAGEAGPPPPFALKDFLLEASYVTDESPATGTAATPSALPVSPSSP